ncbi:hypothetical protein ACOBQJ_02840 [Pelotomaculum propionicicum]|uniref:hypothetical protein n=1 Tax=Pelotomaculum propionicicum TaxID=258475 RepID=UPI003B761D33
MKKFFDNNTQMSQQEFSGLTISELEKQLITEEPESGIKNVFHALTRWGRLLIVFSLAVILIFVACYIQNLKKEIYELRRELNERPGNTSQVENIEQNQPVEKTPTDSSQEENDGQGQPVEESSPDSSQEENEGQGQPVEESSPDSPQEENDGQEQSTEEYPPAPSQGEVDGQSQSVAENPAG